MLKVGHLAENAIKRKRPLGLVTAMYVRKGFIALLRRCRLVLSRLVLRQSSQLAQFAKKRENAGSRNSETSLLFETRATSTRKKKRGFASPRCFLASFI